MRPQKRVFRLFGVVMVTLCPAGSTQPVAASGVAGLGAAATQMVCDILLTNVTRRREPAAPEGGGSEAAGAEEAEEAEERRTDVAEGILASVGVAERALGDGVAVITADWLAAVPVAAFAVAAGALAEAAPAPFVPRAAQPAVSMMALSSAAVVSAPDNRVRRRPPFRPNSAEHHQRPPCVHVAPYRRRAAAPADNTFRLPDFPLSGAMGGVS